MRADQMDDPEACGAPRGRIQHRSTADADGVVPRRWGRVVTGSPNRLRLSRPDAGRVPDSEPVQLPLPIEMAPTKVRAHGLRDAHSRPLVSRGKDRGGNFSGSWRVGPEEAWGYPQLELRAANTWPALILDCDGHEGTERLAGAILDGRVGPANWTVTRIASGGSHAVWCLDRPVLRGADARAKPMHAFGRVAEYYAEAVGADRGYGGVLTHNPMARAQPRGMRTTWGRRDPYSLAALAEPIPRGWRRPDPPASAIGRNCAIFGALMRFAGHQENQLADLAAAAGALNRQLDDPLDAVELVGIVRSVERYRAGWIAQGAYYSVAEREEWGRARGIRSGQVRRDRTAERDAAILEDRAAGLSQRAIAAKHGVSRGTVENVLRRGAVQLLLFDAAQ